MNEIIVGNVVRHRSGYTGILAAVVNGGKEKRLMYLVDEKQGAGFVRHIAPADEFSLAASYEANK